MVRIKNLRSGLAFDHSRSKNGNPGYHANRMYRWHKSCQPENEGIPDQTQSPKLPQDAQIDCSKPPPMAPSPQGAEGMSPMERLICRCALVVMAIITTIFVYACCLRIFGGVTLQRTASPDGAVIAEVNASGAAGATDTAYLSVRLRDRLNPFREDVFGGLDYGAHITVRWADSRNLSITCGYCTKLQGVILNWTAGGTSQSGHGSLLLDL
jgi:hypothetical protein